MASLRALALCCTLKKSPALSSSALIAREIPTALADHGVAPCTGRFLRGVRARAQLGAVSLDVAYAGPDSTTSGCSPSRGSSSRHHRHSAVNVRAAGTTPNHNKIGAVMVLDHWHAVADFTVELRDRTPDGVTVAMSGELDRDTGAEAQRVITELLRNERPGYVAVDMSQVTFMGTDGIRLLIICRRAAEQVNCRFGISQAHARVREVLAMVHLDDVLSLSPGAPLNA